MAMRSKVIPYLLPAVFFFLPWQTRYIFDRVSIAGHPSEFGVVSLYAVEVLVVIAFLFYGRLQIEMKYRKTLGLTLFILCFAFLSLFWSLNADVAFGQFAHVLIAIMLFLLLLDTRTDLRKVAVGFVAGLMLPIGLGVWQVVTGGSGASTLLGLAARDAHVLGDAVLTLSDGTRLLRAYGSFSHPNIFGGFLVVGIFSTLFCHPWLDQGSSDCRSRYSMDSCFCRNNKKWGATTSIVVSVIFLIAFILTFSQSAWLALIIGILCGAAVIWWHRRQAPPPYEGGDGGGCRFIRFKILAGIFTALMLVGSVAGVLILGRLGFDQASIAERAQQYQEWPEVMSGAMILGFGLGNYSFTLETFDQTREWWQYQPIHHVPLLIVGELGIIGLILIGFWAASIDALNFERMRSQILPLHRQEKRNSVPLLTKEGIGEVFRSAPLVAFMMSCALLVIAGIDHYLWTQWSGLGLIVYVMALMARIE